MEARAWALQDEAAQLLGEEAPMSPSLSDVPERTPQPAATKDEAQKKRSSSRRAAGEPAAASLTDKQRLASMQHQKDRLQAEIQRLERQTLDKVGLIEEAANVVRRSASGHPQSNGARARRDISSSSGSSPAHDHARLDEAAGSSHAPWHALGRWARMMSPSLPHTHCRCAFRAPWRAAFHSSMSSDRSDAVY